MVRIVERPYKLLPSREEGRGAEGEGSNRQRRSNWQRNTTALHRDRGDRGEHGTKTCIRTLSTDSAAPALGSAGYVMQ